MKKRMHVLSNTHWDREHRHSFPVTRLMLVKLIDELIETMENDPEYKFFTMDGQSIILDDYLEVKPHMKERLTKLIEDGRILIGPWYSLVDCYSVNPESIVRNLLYGNKVCTMYKRPMKVGYSIFSFGQIAQLPQIYGGFGIKDIMFYKGANEQAFPKSEFLWKAPDGTTAIATRLGKEKRWNFYFAFTLPVIMGGNAFRPGWKTSFTDNTRLVHMIDDNFDTLYSAETQHIKSIYKDKIPGAVEELLDDTKNSVSENVKVGFDGTDFIASVKEIPEALKVANEMQDDMEFIHSNPEEYFKDFRKDIEGKQMQEYEGEMRFGPVDSLHSETMGSNIDIKILDAKVENELIFYAEPLCAISFMLGGKYPVDELSTAWRYLFQAHAHDSIHGSGDPQIKLDNINRLQQVNEMNRHIIKEAVEDIAKNIDRSKFDEDDILIMVLNPTIYQRSEALKLTIDLPREEVVKDFWLEDLDGNRLQMYSHGTKDFNMAMISKDRRPKTVLSQRADVDVFVEDVPSYGYKLLKLKRVKGDPDAYPAPFPPCILPYKPIAKSGNILDNGLIRAEIMADGTINVYDYETKKTYNKLHYFEDTACSGDFWVHREPQFNQTISSIGGGAKISVIRNSAISATYAVEIEMKIPERLTPDKKARLDKLVKLPIRYEVSLSKGDKKLTFKTTIDNQAKDHLLTLNIPTSISSDEILTDAPFELRRRKIDCITDNNGKNGPELARIAIQNFVDTRDKKNSVTLMTKGLKEVKVSNECDDVLYGITLLRAVSGTFPIHNDCFVSFENENAQCIGTIKCEYALSFDIPEKDVVREVKKYVAPVVAAEVGNGVGGKLSGVESFIKSNITVAAVKLAENKKGIILRLNNQDSSDINAKIEFSSKVKIAYLCNMLEEKTADVSVKDNTVSYKSGAYKIDTLYIEF